MSNLQLWKCLSSFVGTFSCVILRMNDLLIFLSSPVYSGRNLTWHQRRLGRVIRCDFSSVDFELRYNARSQEVALKAVYVSYHGFKRGVDVDAYLVPETGVGGIC